MIYAAFTFWLFMILFAGAGVYRLWTQMARPGWVNWALFPGTVVSEMAYIFGCLITGGEIRRARLMGSKSDSPAGRSSGEGGPATEATARLKYVGPIVAAIMAILACGAAIVLVHELLGGPVIVQFATAGGVLPVASLPKELPLSLDAFWDQLTLQVSLLRRMGDTLGSLNWLRLPVPLFVYLSACLSVRLGPVGREMRASLAAVAVSAGVIAAIGAVSGSFANLLSDVWPLLTYIWTSLLFLLTATLAVRGLLALVRTLIGKGAA